MVNTEIMDQTSSDDKFVYLMLERNAESLTIPAGWVKLELEDLSEHTTYPALVQEIEAGYVGVYGKLPESSSTLSSSMTSVGDLIQQSLELKRVTILSVSEKESYMSDMVQLLSHFKFEPSVVTAIATSLCHPGDRSRWTWLMRITIGDCIQVISELNDRCENVPPLLELWHLRVDSSSWLNLASSLTSVKTAIPKMILNDVALLEDESIQGIVEACLGVRICEMDAVGKSFPGKLNYFWSMFSQRLINSENSMVLETLILKQIGLDNNNIESIASCITNVKHAIIVNNEMNKKQWARFALEINRTEKRLQTLEFLTLEDVEADQGRYLARVVAAVDVIKLSEAKLTTDQWEEIGKEIRQPHSKLRKLHLADMTFNNTEFAMFCRCIDNIRELHLTDLTLTRSQLGIIAKRLSGSEARTERLTLDTGGSAQDKDSLMALNSLKGFKLIEKGKITVFERY